MATLGMAPRRVLVVDDDPLVADSIRRMLQFDGHQVEVAGNAERALELVSNATFDLALVDYEMPKMKGDKLAQEIKARLPGLPVVMFTGYAEVLCSAATGSKDIDLILGKPFDLEELRRTVAHFPLRA